MAIEQQHMNSYNISLTYLSKNLFLIFSNKLTQYLNLISSEPADKKSNRPHRFNFNAKACLVAIIGLLPTLLQAQGAPSVKSPEMGQDNQLIFRLYAPQAESVVLTSGGDFPHFTFSGLPLSKGSDGIWEVSVGPMDPGAYRYAFMVDGVRVLDPVSPELSVSNENAWSLAKVSGSSWMDTLDVPHGAVAKVTYNSSVLRRDRQMHVYTPPGFGRDGRRYPVFYLLHGAYDSDNSWSTVGRAGFILDNLIASGEAEPMIVVMPHGHTGPMIRNTDGTLPPTKFVEEFTTDIKPYIETHYPIRLDRDSTAIAGLSMGGAQTMDISFGNIEEYGYVGVFSSGIFSINQNDSWYQAHTSVLNNSTLRDGLHLLWYGVGVDDFLIETTRSSVKLLEDSGFAVEYEETAGGHTWIVWREYLHRFASRLFK
jgi:enterochelin esterase-like enzyme